MDVAIMRTTKPSAIPTILRLIDWLNMVLGSWQLERKVRVRRYSARPTMNWMKPAFLISMFGAKLLQSRRGFGSSGLAIGAQIATPIHCERLLATPPRTTGGRRVYGERHRRTLGFIRRARDLGFNLDEIRALLDLDGSGRASCAEVREIASGHLAKVRAKLADLARLEAVLSETVGQCAANESRVPCAWHSRHRARDKARGRRFRSLTRKFASQNSFTIPASQEVADPRILEQCRSQYFCAVSRADSAQCWS